MLVPRHPQPVGRRREVAAVVVATRQAATIAPGHVLRIPAGPAPLELPEPPGQGDPVAPAPGEPVLSRDGHDTPV